MMKITNDNINNLLNNKSLNFSLLDQCLVSGCNFLTTIIIFRLLDFYEFGVFASLWLILLFITTLHQSLLVLPMMTLVPKQKLLENYFGNLILGQLAFMCCSFIIVSLSTALYLNFIDYIFSIKIIMLYSMVVIFYLMQDFLRRYFFVKQDFINVLLIDFLTYLLRILILGFCLLYSISITLIDVYSILLITFLLGSAVGLVKCSYNINFNTTKMDFLQHWSLSKWLLPSGLMQWTSVNLFLVISSFVLGPIVVGILRLGQNIVMIFNVILQALENFIPTDASRIYISSGYADLLSYLKRVNIIGFSLVCLFGIVVSIMSEEIISMLYGKENIRYSFVIIWWSAILIFTFLLTIMRILLRTIDEVRLWFNALLITSIYSLIIVYPILKIFQITGALFGILSANVVLFLSLYIMMKNKIKI